MITAAKQTRRDAGLTLAEVERLTGVSRQTLSNWQRNRPKLFAVILRGLKDA